MPAFIHWEQREQIKMFSSQSCFVLMVRVQISGIKIMNFCDISRLKMFYNCSDLFVGFADVLTYFHYEEVQH